MTGFHHVSVLMEECLEALAIRPEGVYVDGTLGGAGHASRVVSQLTTGRLIGIDRDSEALAAAGERLEPWKARVTLVHGNFRDLESILADLGISKVDGVLLDLGVSSYQLDRGERGFSYRFDAPLDMRMDGSDALTAGEIVNTWPQEELRRILYAYGTPPRSPPPFAGPGSGKRFHPPWPWRRSSAPPCRPRRCGKSSTLPSGAFRPCVSPSTMSWQRWRRGWTPPSTAWLPGDGWR